MSVLRLRAVAVVATLGALAGAGPASAHARAHRIGGVIADVARAAPVHPAVAARSARAGAAVRAASEPGLPYQGGSVLHRNRTHLVFWQPARSGLVFEPGYEALIEQFLARVAADSHHPTNVYGLTGQYRDAQGPAAYASSYGGAVLDSDRLPANQCAEPPAAPPGWSVCLTDTQLEAELERVVSAHHLPRGADDIYFIVLPDGFGSCIDSSSQACALGGGSDGYCGYHSETQDGLLYAVIPYNGVPGHCQSSNPRPNGSAADPTISSLSHEHNETITDPQLDAWIDSAYNEDGDLCISDFGPALGGSGSAAWDEVIDGGHYWIQEEWSNEDNSCQPRDESDTVSFSVSGRAVSGAPLTLTGHAGDPDGRIVAYSWSFGDRGSARHRASTHTYGRAGAYRVILRVTDSAGNWAFATRTLRIASSSASRRHGGRGGTSRRGAAAPSTRRAQRAG